MKIMLFDAVRFASTGLLLFISLNVFAINQAPSIYPEPQKSNFTGERFVVPAFRIESHISLANHTSDLVNTVFQAGSVNKRFWFVVKKLAAKVPDLKRAGAYQLAIGQNGITIEANSQRAVYYAVQTLLQLAERGSNGLVTLPVGQITDFPDVAFRGTVEGFYGDPWSHQDRIEQLRFYGKLKLNTYIYGPKDDPYHSSPNWRLAYPAENAQQIKDLVEEAKRNEVDFVWAIHPGKDIQWNLTDSLAILKKMDMMYALGVRSFAVFFDDISGSGTNASKQAGLLNYIQKDFIRKKKDAGVLIMCPTEYNKSWSDPKPNTYLDILGEQLDPAVYVMWTGNRVVDDITKEGLEWVNRRIKRPAFVWWNFPVSDYVRDHLLMGPSYGLDTDASTNMSGFVSNPMDKAEASKPAIFSIALYSWNMKSYHPAEAWQAGNKFIMPEASEAFQLFNTHNSDPGPNGHRYRREESVDIKPSIDSFLLSYGKGSYQEDLAERISSEFQNIIPVGKQLKEKSKNRRMIEQISPWLIQFELLGRAGTSVMRTAALLEQKNKKASWSEYLKVESLLDSMATIDKTFNQNPYQPGIETGSLVLTPFMKEMFKLTGASFIKAPEKQALSEKANRRTSIYTNSEKLRNQPLLLDNSSVAISPVLEVLALNKGEYFGLSLADGLLPADLQFTLESGNLSTWGRFEVSSDGNSWHTIPVVEKRGKGNLTTFSQPVQLIRFINFSDTTRSLFLKGFKLSIKPLAEQEKGLFAHDGSIQTFTPFSNASPAKVNLPDNLQKTTLSFLLKTNGEKVSVFALNKRGKKTLVHQGSEEMFSLSTGQLKKAKSLLFETEGSVNLRVYEIVKN